MPGKRSADKSTTGVTMLDVLQCMEEARRNYENGFLYVAIEEGPLGGLFLSTVLTFRIGGRMGEVITEEPWLPVKGRLEAFLYRSCIDTMKEADRQLTRVAAGHPVR